MAFMINPPWIFSAFWKVISRFLDPVTAAKIVFTDKQSTETQQFIEPENLESDYGGTNSFRYDYATWKAQRFPGVEFDEPQ